MKHLAIALLSALFLLGAQSAVAGSCTKGKGGCAKTALVPAPVVEVKPLPPPEMKCRVVKWTSTSTEGGVHISVPAEFIQSGCCCQGIGTFIQGVNAGVPSTPTTVIQQTVVCEDDKK